LKWGRWAGWDREVLREMPFCGLLEGPGIKYRAADVVEAAVEEIFFVG